MTKKLVEIDECCGVEGHARSGDRIAGASEAGERTGRERFEMRQAGIEPRQHTLFLDITGTLSGATRLHRVDMEASKKALRDAICELLTSQTST
jgi:hypothetical protein